jgi:hypothetical protein
MDRSERPVGVPGKHGRIAERLEDLPNVAGETAGDLRLLGVQHPLDLYGRDPLALYRQLEALTGARQDPCVLDVFIALTRLAAGDPPRPWWHYTAERKQRYGELHPTSRKRP